MKTSHAQNTYHRNEALDHGNFKIANTAFMANMLSRIYSDPIKAVIRELSTNAYDAHIQDGHNEPFEVHLPTADKPVFSIRDFGTGLSKEDLKNLYCVYGYSNKRDSNDVVGCFGIGSKSPFSYTNMFTVISYYNGNKYTICNSKDGNSKFCYDFLAEETTTESNGLEIIINVEKKDIHLFQQKGKDIYRYFKVKPKFTNWQITYTDIVVKDKGDDWEISAKGNNEAVMGQVPYEINSSQFTGTTSSVLNGCQPVLHFTLGEIDITPSRETLEYTQKTKDAIITKCDKIYNHLKKQAEEAIKGCKSLWEARILAHDFFNGKRSYIGSILNNKVSFNGQIIEGRGYLPASETGILQLRKYTWGSYPARPSESIKYNSVDVNKKCKFAIVDSPAPYAGAKRYITAHQDEILYLFTPYTIPGTASNNPAWATTNTDITVKDLIKIIGVTDADIILSSTFPPVVKQLRKARVKRVKNVYKGFTYNNSGYSGCNAWSTTDIDLENDSGYYCRLLRFQIEDKISSGNKEFNEIFGSNKLVGLPENKIDKFKNHKNWTHISEFYKKYLDKHLTPDIIKYWEVSAPYEFTELYKIRNKILTTSKICPVIEDYSNYHSIKNKIDKLKVIYNQYIQLGHKYPINSQKHSFEVFDKIPILEFISYYQYSKQPVLDIINN